VEHVRQLRAVLGIELRVHLIDVIVLAREVNYAVSNPCSRNESVIRQLSLQVHVPLLAVGCVAVFLGAKGVDLVAGAKAWAEGCGVVAGIELVSQLPKEEVKLPVLLRVKEPVNRFP